MKIGSYDTTPAAGTATTAASGERKTNAQTRTAGAAAGPSATVQLSAAAVAAADGGDGSFDAGKVERISESIRDGSYQIDPGAIADKLIANARELLGRTPE